MNANTTALEAVIDAYRQRFYVEGRGLVGPIDKEIKEAIAAIEQSRSSAAEPEGYRLFMDGDQWCCVGPKFINLQESDAGFGSTARDALEAFEMLEGEKKRAVMRANDWKPSVAPAAMTDEQIADIVRRSEVFEYHPGAIIEFVRSIEAALSKGADA